MLASIYPANVMLSYLGSIVPACKWQAHQPDFSTFTQSCSDKLDHHPHKMTNTLSLDFKSSALLIALVLVPIVTLFGAVAVALACSEYWSCHRVRPTWLAWFHCRRLRYKKKKRINSGLESSRGIRGTDLSDAPLDYAEPVSSHEQV